jgi:autotransporter translocation and assembly factor TamB
LRFQQNHLAIDALQLHDDDGHELSATGGVDVFGNAATRAFDVKVTSSGIHVLHNALGTLQVNADIEVSGDFSAPKVTGTIAIDSGRLQVDKILAKTTKSAYSLTPGSLGEELAAAAGEPASRADAANPAPAPPKPPAPKGLSDRVDVNLTVSLPDNLVMQGRNLRAAADGMGLGDMNVIAGGRVAIVKPAGGELSIVGDVEIVRGTYSFQGKRFDISRGSTVQFRGDDPANPSLSVSAERQVNGVDATVSVKGTAKRPQVTLSSVPPLDQAEILSLIVFGQSVGDLGTGDRTALADRAAAMAAGTITTPFADSVARALDLDTFEILAPSDNEQLPVVSVGSTIGSRVYVGLKHEVGGQSSAVSFEYRFTRFLRLVTSFAQGALETHALERVEAGGVDLLFVFRY